MASQKEYSHDEAVKLYEEYKLHYDEFQKRGARLRGDVEHLMQVWMGQASKRFDDKAGEWLAYYDQSSRKFAELTTSFGSSLGDFADKD